MSNHRSCDVPSVFARVKTRSRGRDEASGMMVGGAEGVDEASRRIVD